MGSKYKEKYLGTFGLASFFSMYFGHHLSTIEGGFINTNDKYLYNSLLMMRSHGWSRDLSPEDQDIYNTTYNTDSFSSLYNFYLPGFNLRSTDLQAFIGLRAIDKLDNYSQKRNLNFKFYLENITNNELEIKNDSNDFISSFAIPIVSKNKEQIVKDLIEANIEVRPLIAGNLGNKPVWYENYERVNLPNSNIIDKFGFYLPNHQDLTESDILKITNIINKNI
jgi:CDP-6-deoxy-D-xylo-4-hexulose-3-dehydrase